MQKPPLDGMAIADSLCGSVEEQDDFNVATPPDKFNPELVRIFLTEDHEAGRPMPSDPYEREKRILNRYPLSADEIQSERKGAAERCGV